MNILSLLFPERCIGCGTRDEALCAQCVKHIEPANETPKGSFAAFSYTDPIIRKAIWHLKFRGKRGLALPLGVALHEHLMNEWAERHLGGGKRPMIVVPVPLSPMRIGDRGYNQAALLALELAKLLGIPHFEDAVKKIKETTSQVELKNRKDRLENPLGAFIVPDRSVVEGKTIILVDDVLTTGATLREVSRVLRESGAHKVLRVALAH